MMRRVPAGRSFIPALLVVVLFVVYVAKNGSFGAIEALGISNAALPLALVAAGETFVILTNGIDLSIGAMVTLSNVTCADVAVHGHGVLAVLLALAVGAGAGAFNGVVVSFTGIAPLIATLASSSIFAGIALIVLPTPGGSVPSWLSNVTAGSVHSVPVAVFWLAGGIVTGWAILHRLPFGINLRALGGSESASWSAGVKVTRVRILAYVASGFYCGLAGVVLAGLTQSGDPNIGVVYLLNGIAAVVVGGTSLVGGVGTVAGSILGAIALSLVSAVLLVSGLSTNYQYIVTGLIVIGALLAHAAQAQAELRSLAREPASQEASA
jgi:ribose transport system permease protein